MKVKMVFTLSPVKIAIADIMEKLVGNFPFD